MISARKGITPVIAIVLLLMMTVAAAGMAYVWVTGIQQDTQNKVSQNMQTRVNQMAGSVGIDAVYENGTADTIIVLVRNTGSVTFTKPAKVYVGPVECGDTGTQINDMMSTGTVICSSTDPGFTAGALNVSQDQIISVIPPEGTKSSIYCDCRPKNAAGACTVATNNYCAI